MKTKFTNTTNKGFTLVELLVVIGIITGVAAIGYPIIMRQVNKGKDVETLMLAQHFAIGVESYEQHMLMYPFENSGQTPDDDEAYYLDNARIVDHLAGHDAAINKEKINFIPEMQISTTGKSGFVKANINGSNAGNAVIKTFADAWGNPYVVLFDHNYDNVINGFSVGNVGNVSPGNNNGNQGNNNSNNDVSTATMDDFMSAYKNDKWTGNVVIISAGRDGIFNKKNDLVFVR